MIIKQSPSLFILCYATVPYQLLERHSVRGKNDRVIISYDCISMHVAWDNCQ
jgi:hypothetical protein